MDTIAPTVIPRAEGGHRFKESSVVVSLMEPGMTMMSTRVDGGAAAAEISSEAEHKETTTAQRVLERLEADLGHDKMQRYFSGQTRFTMIGDRLDVTVANNLLARMLSSQFGEHIKRAAAAVPGATPVEVHFTVDRAAFGAQPAPAPTPASLRASQRHRPAPKPVGRYRFENFVVGAANKLAHAACLRLAEEAAPAAPLFLHGSCGLGKTHLLQATVTRFLERRPTANVKYTTAEAFTNEFITAVRTGKVDAFRKAYRKVDLLCIDDVHFLSNKDATQTELLHTFDAIGLDGARVVLASDEHPREIKKLSDKLVSRFMAGAVVKIDTPDAELRTSLIRHLAAERSMKLDDASVKLLCDRSARSIGSLGGFGGSVRELEGLLIQIEAIHRLLPDATPNHGEISLGLVRRALGLNAADEPKTDGPAPALRPRRPIAAQTIIAEVCRALNVELNDFMGKGRHPRVVLARSVTSFVCRKLTTLSFPEIARAMGRGNHSTVITAHRRVERDIAKKDPIPAELVPNHAGSTLMELIDALSRQIVRHAAGL
ncbi:MAG TPA: DnaA/Hda family protein [Phycisphaerales bacterium]|nr:DnaA/Hda family protein [Phycisphaerales bacterium]